MAKIRVERNKGYTVMSNFHLKDKTITLKSKGLLSMMLSLPDKWRYSTRGLAAICKEGVDAIGASLKELENAGYIIRNQIRGERGRIVEPEYDLVFRAVRCISLLSTRAIFATAVSLLSVLKVDDTRYVVPLIWVSVTGLVF